MARMKKDDLIEEARTLGIDADDDDHYDDILAAVKDAREDSDEDEPDGVDVPDEEPDFEPDFVEVPEDRPRPRGWSKLGVWQGGGRPR